MYCKEGSLVRNLVNHQLFIETAENLNVYHKEAGIFVIKSQSKDQIEYDFINKKIVSLSFVNPKLIDKIEKFIPKISAISQVNEFEDKVGIHLIEFSYRNKRLSISCPTCKSYFIYDLNQLYPISFSLNNNFEWKTFPEISKAHKIIEENLLVGKLSNCTIGTGDLHAYTIGTGDRTIGTGDLHAYTIGTGDRNSPTSPWFMTIAINCDNGWEDASIRLYPNGTYDILKLERDYNPKDLSTPTSFSFIILISIVILIVFAIILFVIKVSIKNV